MFSQSSCYDYTMMSLPLPSLLAFVCRFLLVLFLAIAIFFFPYNVSAQLPFGGFATIISYCDEGILLFVGPPAGYEMMWGWGSVGFDWTHFPIGAQWMLGWTGGFLTCTEGIYVIGGGLLVTSSGFSL